MNENVGVCELHKGLASGRASFQREPRRRILMFCAMPLTAIALRRVAPILVAMLGLGVIALGCGSDKRKVTNPEDSIYLPQSSAANCLTNLQTAYTHRNDIEGYTKLFADSFTFVFNPTDVNNPTNPTPASWDLASERTATDSLFSSRFVDHIRLTFDQDPAVNSDAEYPETWKVLMRRIRLQVDTRKEDGSQLTLLAEGSDATFYFKEYPNERASDGKTLWRIVRWEDQVSEGKGVFKVENSTWGRVKWLYSGSRT
jgi:hypothetical protein